MNANIRLRLSQMLAVCCLSVFSFSLLRADEAKLADRQGGVAERYQRLEELLLRLADVEAADNPERASLLRRAARQSRDQFVLSKLRTASESLRNEQFQNAVESQKEATEGLETLLKLLLSEDRSKRIRDEKQRVGKIIKDLKRIERAERSTRARTENGADLEEVEAEQDSIAQRSEQLKAQLSEDRDAATNQSGQQESSDNNDKQSGDEPKEAKDSDKDKDQEGDKDKDQDQGKDKDKDGNQESKPSDTDSQSKPSSQQSSDQSKQSQQPDSQQQDSQSSDQQQSQQSQQQPSQSQQSQQQQQQSQQPQTPQQHAEQQLQKAIEKMREAERELRDAKRDKAIEKQREAEENLRAAIDSLEKILRQLREEELQRELARLEARLRKMAAMQSQVLDDTIALAATPKEQRNRQTDLKAGDLAFEEKKITLEADRAMLLLREEGSSVAFPEVVSQIRADTTRVSQRLGESKIDLVTQGIQRDILAALEEMIAATQKAQRDLEKKRQQQQGRPSQSGQQEQPLVEALAELKLIRTMETRVKSTTERYAMLLESGESAGEDVLPLLRDLSERQNRLYQITRDLVLKRNQ